MGNMPFVKLLSDLNNYWYGPSTVCLYCQAFYFCLMGTFIAVSEPSACVVDSVLCTDPPPPSPPPPPPAAGVSMETRDCEEDMDIPDFPDPANTAIVAPAFKRRATRSNTSGARYGELDRR